MLFPPTCYMPGLPITFSEPSLAQLYVLCVKHTIRALDCSSQGQGCFWLWEVLRGPIHEWEVPCLHKLCLSHSLSFYIREHLWQCVLPVRHSNYHCWNLTHYCEWALSNFVRRSNNSFILLIQQDWRDLLSILFWNTSWWEENDGGIFLSFQNL